MGGAVSGVLTFIYRNPKLGLDYLRRFLTETDLTPTRNGTQLVNWLAVGRYPISAMAPPDRVGIYDAQKQGLPINIFDSRNFKEGIPLSTSSGNVALIKNAPNPNAAKVAINWLLSREGQKVYQKVNLDKNSLRVDIPKDDVLPHVQRKKGVEYQILAGPGLKELGPVLEVIREVWKKKRPGRRGRKKS
ncbi:MAG: extracellular solute-binding protein [Deltaproteobacteria bacterium]|nr:extracellular solute-binding protein [Deltaproteobacteria bacterium]